MSTAVIKRPNDLLFNPTNFPECNLWLDAADSTTLTIAGTNVTRWNDKSGRGNNGTTTGGTTTVSTLNSVQALLFNGTNAFEGTSITNTTATVTAFMVATMSGATGSNGRLLSCALPSESDNAGNSSVTLLNRLVTGSQVYSTSRGVNTSFVSISTNTPFVMVTQYTGTQSFIFLNGTQQGNASTVTTGFGYTRYRVGNTAGSGGNAFWGGLVGEIIIYNSSLTTSRRQIIEGYLAWKWGLTANLPATHPYKNIPPNVVTAQPPVTISYPLSARSSVFADPRSLGNCVLWMDASDRSASSMTVNAGGTVTSWFSKANTNTLASLGTIKIPGVIGTNNLSTISIGRNAAPVFTNVLGFGGNTAQTNVMVAFVPVNAVSGTLGIIRYLTAAGGNAFGLSLGTDIKYNSVTAFQNQGGASVTLTTSSRAQLGIVMQNGTTQSLFESGTAGSTVNYTLNQIDGRPRVSYLATGAVDNCELGELIIFSKALSTSERQYIEGYLAWKWGLTANLATNHPYKNSPLGAASPPLVVPRSVGAFNPISFMYPAGGSSWYDMAFISGTTLTDVGQKGLTYNGTMSTTMSIVSGPVSKMNAVTIPFGATITMPTGYTSGNFSICFWINFAFKSGTGLGTYQYFLSNGRLQVHQHLRQLQGTTVDSYYYFYDTAGTVNYLPILDSRWYHMVFVYNTSSNQVSFYLNGSLIQTTNQSIGAAANWTIGNSGIFSMSGSLADLRIVPFLMTASQVATFYASFSDGSWKSPGYNIT
jgi:hypothetical protein